MARVADGVLGKAAVDRVAHVLLGLAQRLAAGVAVAAIAARVSEPRKRNTHPDLDPVVPARAELRDDPDTLMAGDEGRRRLDGPLASSRVDVGVTETGSLDPDKNLLGTGLRHRHVLDDQRLVEGMNNCGLHLVPPRGFRQRPRCGRTEHPLLTRTSVRDSPLAFSTAWPHALAIDAAPRSQGLPR